MRKYLLAAVFILTSIFLFTRAGELGKVASTLQAGDWRFVLLAVLFEIVWLWVLGSIFQSLYRTVGIEEDHTHMLKLAAAANFINVVAPSGGMSGMVVFLNDARRRGYPSARVTVVGALYLLFEYMAILVACGLGFIVLFRRNSTNWPAVLAAIILLVAMLAVFGLLILARYRPAALADLLRWIARHTGRLARVFSRREPLTEEQADRFARETHSSVALLESSPRRMLRPALLSLTNKGVLIIIMALVFMAFKVPYSLGTLVAGFSLGYLFAIVSPTPSGIGIVEGVMTLALRSLGVPLEPAAVITLAFRGVTFWQPLFIGGYMFRRVNKKGPAKIEGIN